MPDRRRNVTLRVAYIGNFDHRHCTEVHVAATLEDLGAEVIRLQENRSTLETIEERSTGADMLLYTRTWSLPYPLQAIEMFRRLEAAGTVTASFHLDLYLGLVREATLDGDPFWATQLVLTPDGAASSEAEFARRGINHVWSPPAVFDRECVPGTFRAQFAHDVVFVGSYPYPHPEWPYRDQLVEWVSATYGAGYQRYGGQATVIRNEPLNDLYASAKVVVGDSCNPGNHPRYWSDRLTETLGRGGFLIWPRIDGVEELGFVDGEHFRVYELGDFDELKSLIDHYIAHPDEGRAIANAGQVFVREHHTYRNRMARLMEAAGLEF